MALYDERDTIIAGLRQQLKDAREELAAERSKDSGIEEGVAQLRQALAPLKEGLDRIFGILPETQVPAAYQTAKTSAVWESWKKKLGGGAVATIIDALMLHGSLTQTQMMLHVGTSRKQTIYDAVHKLNKAGIINKNGDKISLKEL
jgi:hypothetical protein